MSRGVKITRAVPAKFRLTGSLEAARRRDSVNIERFKKMKPWEEGTSSVEKMIREGLIRHLKVDKPYTAMHIEYRHELGGFGADEAWNSGFVVWGYRDDDYIRAVHGDLEKAIQTFLERFEGREDNAGYA